MNRTNIRNIFFGIISFVFIFACNSSKKAEVEDVREITAETLDSVIVHYLERLETGENMLETTKEEFELLNSYENRLVEQLNECLEDKEFQVFEKNQLQWEKDWERKKDSVQEANIEVIFKEDPESKTMFLIWQYIYLKELRIIELLRIRNRHCE